jgi:hypothetical protein
MRWITAAIACESHAARERLPASTVRIVLANTVTVFRVAFLLGRTGILFPQPKFQPRGGVKIKPDWISGLLIVLLTATVWAFFSGAFPYPYGWIVLLVLLVMRLTARQKQE